MARSERFELPTPKFEVFFSRFSPEIIGTLWKWQRLGIM